MFSLIVPVYRNEGSIPELLETVAAMNSTLDGQLEAVFVVDGSPDRSHQLLLDGLQGLQVRARLLGLSRNFGSFAAIRVGLAAAAGPYFAVMAADLQEPPELILRFFEALRKQEVDVVVGTRQGRDDPLLSRLASGLFWRLYRLFVVREMPAGGVDVFGCNQAFRNELLKLEESHTSLVALLFWLGFRRGIMPYRRLSRRHGRSAWTLGRKVKYLLDSVFAFTDLPIRVLVGLGAMGVAVSALLGVVVLVARVTGTLMVPGYAATALLIMFFGALGLLSNGLVGSYVWRTYENSKRRPLAVVMTTQVFPAAMPTGHQPADE